MTGLSNTYSSVLRNAANIVTIIVSLITTQLTMITRFKTLKHQSPPRKRCENIGNGGWGLKKRRWRRHIEYHLYINTHYCIQTLILSKSTSISHPRQYIQWISISNPFNIHIYVPSSSRKGHPPDVHFKTGQDVDVNWIFGPKMNVHRSFCAIWGTIHLNFGQSTSLPCLKKIVSISHVLPEIFNFEIELRCENPESLKILNHQESSIATVTLLEEFNKYSFCLQCYFIHISYI